MMSAHRWYDSTLETLYTNLPGIFPKYLQAVIPFTKQWTNMMEKFIWQGTFKGRFTDRDFAISVFNERTEEVSELSCWTSSFQRCWRACVSTHSCQ
jgi:hypothetical protein